MKRAGDTKADDDGFTTRTVMAMATEMAEAKRSMDRACIAFAALANSMGVKVRFDELR